MASQPPLDAPIDAPFDADVIIIGYGPSGVAAANFLGARGVRAIAIERARNIYARARAVTVNDWTLRCFQAVGLADRLKAGMDVTHSLRWITYQGQELRRVAFGPGQMGHAASYAIYQPTMEQTLRDGADRYADHVAIRYGVEASGLAQDAVGVTVTTTDLDTGASATVRARYALACDGGSSQTREWLGIALLGDTIETKWVVIDAKVKRWWPNRHILTFWSDKHRPVVDIALAHGNHRWELPLRANEQESDFATHGQLWPLLSTMGVTPDDVDIHQHAFYKHHVRRAEQWRQGRVFLLGDAAHLMPPWAGQGMQSGIRDADNISWKLAEVLSGRLPDSILDSYQIERAPDVEHYTQMSVGLGRIIRQELSDTELAAMPAPPSADAPPETAPMSLPSITAGWITGKPRASRAIGKMIPQPEVIAGNGRIALLDDVIGNGFVLLGDGIDPRDALDPGERAQWDALQASYRRVLTPDRHSSDATDIVDVGSVLPGWMRKHGARVIAIRPDRFVAASDATGLALPVAHLRTADSDKV